MKKKYSRSSVDTDAKLPKSLNPKDALKFKLAMATRLIEKKEKNRLLASIIKRQMKNDVD